SWPSLRSSSSPRSGCCRPRWATRSPALPTFSPATSNDEGAVRKPPAERGADLPLERGRRSGRALVLDRLAQCLGPVARADDRRRVRLLRSPEPPARPPGSRGGCRLLLAGV